MEFESDEYAELGTKMNVVGERSCESYPVDWSQCQGEKDVFNNVNSWNTETDYSVGNLVNVSGNVYECTTNHTSAAANEPPHNFFWIVRTF